MGEGVTRRERLKASGLCIQCRAPASGRTRCERCLAAQRAMNDRVYAERVASGLCNECGDQAEVGRVKCRLHLDLNNLRKQVRLVRKWRESNERTLQEG